MVQERVRNAVFWLYIVGIFYLFSQMKVAQAATATVGISILCFMSIVASVMAALVYVPIRFLLRKFFAKDFWDAYVLCAASMGILTVGSVSLYLIALVYGNPA
jgi:hypothetical protein